MVGDQVEMELFQHYRVADFKKIIVVYLEVRLPSLRCPGVWIFLGLI